jgi:preprotein translocase SecF subunit
MLQIFKQTNYDFIGRRFIAYGVSIALLLVSLISLALRGGPNYGVDFTGGVLLQLHFDRPISTDQIRATMGEMNMATAEIQRLGTANDFLIRTRGVEIEAAGADTSGPEVLIATVTPNPTAGARTVTLKAQVSDERYGDARIDSVQFRVQPAGAWTEMSAVETFDKSLEEAIVTLPVEGWRGDSTYAVLVRARDALGNWGPSLEVRVRATAAGDTALPVDFVRVVPPPARGVSPALMGGEGEALRSPGERLAALIKARFPDNPPRIDNEELVGPKVGRELRSRALWALLAGLGLILVYVWFRFDFRFGVAAVLSMAHDAVVILGFMSVLNMEFTLQSVAVLLTIVGYSINDSIVVADRIRENRRLMRREPFPSLVNASINQTLSRTVVTAFGVILVLIFLFFLGGRIIHDFATALLFGVVVGTYSSIFVVAALVVDWERLLPSKISERKRR